MIDTVGGRGKSRLPTGSRTWDSIPEFRDHDPSQRQMPNHWTIQVPLKCVNFSSAYKLRIQEYTSHSKFKVHLSASKKCWDEHIFKIRYIACIRVSKEFVNQKTAKKKKKKLKNLVLDFKGKKNIFNYRIHEKKL